MSPQSILPKPVTPLRVAAPRTRPLELSVLGIDDEEGEEGSVEEDTKMADTER